MKRGVVYTVWTGKGLTGCGQVGYETLLERSLASVAKHLPGVPVEIIRGDPALGLLNKTSVGRRTPFESTLFLDADTVLLGDVSYAWDRAEQFGLAVSIGQCPWLRRYGPQYGDMIEYNTGVLFFTRQAKPVFDLWEKLGPESPPSRFMQGGTLCGLECDDQWAFGKAVADSGFNPYVLPRAFNLMPGWDTRFFTPVKIWHSIHDVPAGMEEASLAAASGEKLISFCAIGDGAVPYRNEKRVYINSTGVPDNGCGADKIVLHVGCGPYDPRNLHRCFYRRGWKEVRLDIDQNARPDVIASVTDMNVVADDSVDAVYASHVLEHLAPHEVTQALLEFRRVVKPGGAVLLTMPDLQTAGAWAASDKLDQEAYEAGTGVITPLDVIYGYSKLTRDNPYMLHKTGFTARTLGDALRAAGFVEIIAERDEDAFALWALAYKAA